MICNSCDLIIPHEKIKKEELTKCPHCETPFTNSQPRQEEPVRIYKVLNKKSNKEYGPYSEEEINVYIKSGNIKWNDLIRKVDEDEWRKAETFGQLPSHRPYISRKLFIGLIAILLACIIIYFIQAGFTEEKKVHIGTCVAFNPSMEISMCIEFFSTDTNAAKNAKESEEACRMFNLSLDRLVTQPSVEACPTNGRKGRCTITNGNHITQFTYYETPGFAVIENCSGKNNSWVSYDNI